MEAFCLLYSKKPLEKITVQEIARKAGFNRSTFYQYFLDVNDLLCDVENEFLKYISDKRGQAGAGSTPFIEDIVVLYETKSIYINALFGRYGSNQFLERLKAAVKLEMPELDQSTNDGLKPYLMEYRFSGALSLFRFWLSRGKDLSTQEFLTLIANLYEHGASSISFIENGERESQ